jgi:hypothetical protein
MFKIEYFKIFQNMLYFPSQNLVASLIKPFSHPETWNRIKTQINGSYQDKIIITSKW